VHALARFVAILLAPIGAASAQADPAQWRTEGWRTDFGRMTVASGEIFDGGPPRDGIPAIDRPQFKPIAAIADLAAQDPVIALVVDGTARAYPLRILTWHEIVNDVVSGRPVAVTYCPLCNAALVFDRRLDSTVLDFGTTGKLRNSDLVMYDRQTDSWWQQFSGESIAGAHAGRRLKLVASRVMAFATFKAAYPHGEVLVPENAAMRQYGANPYVGYDTRDAPYPLFRGDLPKGLPAMTYVVVARFADGPKAVALPYLAKQRRLDLDGTVFTWEPGMASALDGARIADSRDLGAVAVTDRGGAPVPHDVTFAFVLFAFHPTAAVLTEAGAVGLGGER
jgi:hypothetical protein